MAAALHMDGAERWHLYRLAEATPMRTHAEPAEVPAGVRDVLGSLCPLPAALVNCRFDVIGANAAHEDMFWDWHSLPCVHMNLLWCTVTEPRAREQLLNYDEEEEEVPHIVARLRAAYAQHVGDPEWEEDIRRLSGLSPEFADLCARHEVAGPAVRTRRFVHDRAGPMTFTVTELDVAAAPDLRIVVYSPSDDATRDRLPRTRRERAPDQPD